MLESGLAARGGCLHHVNATKRIRDAVPEGCCVAVADQEIVFPGGVFAETRCGVEILEFCGRQQEAGAFAKFFLRAVIQIGSDTNGFGREPAWKSVRDEHPDREARYGDGTCEGGIEQRGAGQFETAIAKRQFDESPRERGDDE